MKLTPMVNFINVKRANFRESLFSSYVLALNELLYEKRLRKILMKLTPIHKIFRSEKNEKVNNTKAE